MAMGKRQAKQPELFIPTAGLPVSPGHPFYRKLNQVLAEAGFDAFVEKLCLPYYARHQGRPSIPPGVYFRMLFVGYMEGLHSQRGIAWRCSDSRSLQEFLGFLPTEATPDHSSLSNIRGRLPQVVHEQVFAFIVALADQHGLLDGKTVGVDSTLLEANAAMKTLERRDSGDDYKTYLRQLAAEEGLENPTEDQLRRFDQKREDKKMSNEEWVSPSDPESKIAKMKDGTTHLAYKAEHVVDLNTELVLAAQVYPADQADSATLSPSIRKAEAILVRAESEAKPEEVAADKGYHKIETLADMAEQGYRTYIPEREQVHDHTWTDKPAVHQQAYRANRRRVRGRRGKRLQRLRSERVERSFAHVCETGGARRSWLRGVVEISKRYLMQVAAHNLGIVMRRLFGIGTPRSLQGLEGMFLALWAACYNTWKWFTRYHGQPDLVRYVATGQARSPLPTDGNRAYSTGC
jgi:transposase